jgi:hypothetical protein
MERSHSLEFQAVRAAPFKNCQHARARVPVVDRGGEEINVGFSDLGAGSGNQLRDPTPSKKSG